MEGDVAHRITGKPLVRTPALNRASWRWAWACEHQRRGASGGRRVVGYCPTPRLGPLRGGRGQGQKRLGRSPCAIITPGEGRLINLIASVAVSALAHIAGSGPGGPSGLINRVWCSIHRPATTSNSPAGFMRRLFGGSSPLPATE